MKRLRLLGGTVLVISMFWLLGVMFSAPTASAATLNVVAGTDGIDNNNDLCQLSEAIQNINNQAQTNDDCLAGDGNNDTINLPSGTVTLSNNPPEIVQSVIIQGQSMSETTIDGDGAYSTLRTEYGVLEVYDLKITGFANDGIQAAGFSSLIAKRVDIDGTNNLAGDDILGIGFYGSGNNASREIHLEDVHVHDIISSVSGASAVGISINMGDNATLTSIMNRVVVDTIIGSSNAAGIGISIGSSQMTPSIIDATISNTIIDNIIGNGDAGLGFTSFAVINNGDTSVDIENRNFTIRNVEGDYSPTYGIDSTLVAIAGVALQPSDSSTVLFNATNSIFSSENTSTGCLALNGNSLYGGQGTVNPLITSYGGNISDDTSCSSYFTDPTDQNNVDPADLMLGTLGDYGGSVPTIPLLPGSIAIDSGTTVAGLTTDARGITRPQCSAYDSGAYEYNDTCPEPTTNDTTALTYPDPITSSTVTLELPNDVTNASVSAISPTTIPKDTFFSYPLGLTSFQFDTTVGATKTITLYYDLPGDPSSYTARKYSTNTKTFSTIQGATITRVTYNNKSQIKLTYNITDGGPLDQDSTANGTVVDPVGLAQASVGVPNTGLGGIK